MVPLVSLAFALSPAYAADAPPASSTKAPPPAAPVTPPAAVTPAAPAKSAPPVAAKTAPAVAVKPPPAKAPPVRAADAPAAHVIVVSPHARLSPEVAISDEQDAMLSRIDEAITEIEPRNTVSTAATIVQRDMLDQAITDHLVGGRLSEPQCQSGLARALGADSFLRVEVVSIEGPLGEPVEPPPPAPAPTPPAPTPAVTAPAPAPEPADRKGHKHAKESDKKDHGKPDKLVAPAVAAPAPAPKVERPTVPPVPDANPKWTLRIRLTLVGGNSRSTRIYDELPLERETEAVIRSSMRGKVVAMIDRFKEAVKRREAQRKPFLLGASVAVAVAGAVVLGFGIDWLVINGKPTTTPVPPLRQAPLLYDTQKGGIAMAVVGGAVLAADLGYNLYRALYKPKPSTGKPTQTMGPVCFGNSQGGGVALVGTF